MSDKIDENNKKIESGKRRISSLTKQKNRALERAEEFRKKMEAELANARKLETEQNKIRKKNRTHAMIVLATSLLTYFPELMKIEKDMISNDDFASLNNLILSQFKDYKDGKSEINWNCTLKTTDIESTSTPVASSYNQCQNDNDSQQYDMTIPSFEQLRALNNASESQKKYLKDAWTEISRVLQSCQDSNNFTDVLNLINDYRNADKPNFVIDDFNQIRSLGMDREKLQCLITLHTNK